VIELDYGAMVDHHCHGLVLTDLDRSSFEAWMNEAGAPSPLATTTFDSMLGLAIRRWCAPVLDLPPLSPAEEYLERRRELGAVEASRRLLTAARTSTFLVDTGLRSDRLCTPGELTDLAGGGAAHTVVRLEAIAEKALDEGVPADAFADTIEQRLRSPGTIAAKSIAAYRVGLDLLDSRPTDAELVTAIGGVRRGEQGRTRLAQPVVHSWLAWTALEQGLPLQIHVGYGDSDLDLLASDPLRLTPFLRATRDRGVPVLLLHNYPFHRSAAYLAQVYEHVFMDVGLATHNTGSLSTGVIRETLELVPFGKLLYSSDACGLAEHYLLGSLLFRRALSKVLGDLVADGEMNESDAGRIADLVAATNARRVYALEP
jgi:hypothetical protein